MKQVYEDPRSGFGSIADTLKQARARDPRVTLQEVREFIQGLTVQEDRPQRGFNSYVPI